MCLFNLSTGGLQNDGNVGTGQYIREIYNDYVLGITGIGYLVNLDSGKGNGGETWTNKKLKQL